MSSRDCLARHGHISYLEIPAVDPQAAAAFYAEVFGWTIDRREDGSFRFDDGSGALIGRWVADRPAARDAGWLPFLYVDRVDVVVDQVLKHGGAMVESAYAEGNLRVARVLDPAGNLLGLWQFV